MISSNPLAEERSFLALPSPGTGAHSVFSPRGRGGTTAFRVFDLQEILELFGLLLNNVEQFARLWATFCWTLSKILFAFNEWRCPLSVWCFLFVYAESILSLFVVEVLHSGWASARDWRVSSLGDSELDRQQHISHSCRTRQTYRASLHLFETQIALAKWSVKQ